ncbi:hypothetical protein MINTM001_22980 [Mycobacterium paraintracellulare]|nr:hypothetical protein MINTM001_22980 [Mycobacterium paraintracellulare]
MDAHAQTPDQTRRWPHNLAGFTDQMVQDDAQFRRLLHTGPGFAQEVSRLLDQVKPTLPVFLANLTTMAPTGVTYHPLLEQLLVLLPPSVAAYGSYGVTNNPTGLAVGGFTLTIADPPACTVGFLPPSQWRSPADVSEADTPDNLYCKLPQDSRISVRGARNYPRMTKPGKRAPTVEICNSDQEYVPLAERQHTLGPYPLDPNLLSQGLPPDDRVGIEQRTFGPVNGTPLPAGAAPAGTPPGPPAPDAGAVSAAPSAFGANGSGVSPSVAVLYCNSGTGRYVEPDGQLYRQSDLVRAKVPRTWQDMLLRSG